MARVPLIDTVLWDNMITRTFPLSAEMRDAPGRRAWTPLGKSAPTRMLPRAIRRRLIVPTRKAVFVVDDDPGMLKGIERLLQVHGFDAELFHSAEDFHSRAKLHEASCLVLDVHLQGKSGIELSNELGTYGRALPVIFITANDSEYTRKAANEAGCVAYLAKPFSARSFLDAIEKAVA